MKIKRVVNDVAMEFELTSEELRYAYNEKEMEFFIQDVKNHLDEIVFTEEQIEEIARHAKRTLDSHDMYWDCYACAIDDAIEEYRKDGE